MMTKMNKGENNMEPLTDEQRKKMKQKAASNTYKKRRNRIKMQKLSRKANRGK